MVRCGLMSRFQKILFSDGGTRARGLIGIASRWKRMTCAAERESFEAVGLAGSLTTV